MTTAYITSIDEPTTNLCEWSLVRQGYEVKVLNDSRTLAEKLKAIYNAVDDDFIRVDADIIVNKNVKKLKPEDNCLWHQSMGWDWHSQELKPISVQYIKKEALPILRANIDKFMTAERPESQLFRLDEFCNPRVCEVTGIITGLHGYKCNDVERVKTQKQRRGQIDNYDFELSERINKL